MANSAKSSKCTARTVMMTKFMRLRSQNGSRELGIGKPLPFRDPSVGMEFDVDDAFPHL